MTAVLHVVDCKIEQSQPVRQPSRTEQVAVPDRLGEASAQHAAQSERAPRVEADDQQVPVGNHHPGRLAQHLVRILAVLEHVVQQHDVDAVVGSIILAVAVTVIEVGLIVALMLASPDGGPAIARDTVYSAVMIVLTGLIGLCLVLGSHRHFEQTIRVRGTSSYLAVLGTLAAAAALVTVVNQLRSGEETMAAEGAAKPAPAAAAADAEERTVAICLTVMASFGLAGEDALHAVRALRSTVHGFATREAAGGFGLPLDLDESFRRLVAMLAERNRRTAVSSYDFIEEVMPNARFSINQLDGIRDKQDEIMQLDGHILDLGVYRGVSTKALARIFPSKIIHGFDSFEGLPEDWGHQGKGAFGEVKGMLPDMPVNVKLYKGWFDDTLPDWYSAHNGTPISLLRVDCDLYSSTRTILNVLRPLIRSGTWIVFDEYIGYRTWEEHEYKAFMEFVDETGFEFEYVAYGLTYTILRLL